MIRVTRLGHNADMILNVDLILSIESTPDTVVTLTTGHKYVVQESPDELVRRAIAYRRQISWPGAEPTVPTASVLD